MFIPHPPADEPVHQLHVVFNMAAAVLVVLGWLISALVGTTGSAAAQSPVPTPQDTVAYVTPDATCSASGSAPPATALVDSPYYEYVVLLDVSGSMAGYYIDGSYHPEEDIFAEVKASLKGYVSDLQPGSMVYIVPFGNQVDPARIRQFGIDEPSAPDGGEAEALAYIDSVLADNGETHITESVAYALSMLADLRNDDNREHIQTILLYTDGSGNGPGDLDENNGFDVTNLVEALREFRQEQPYLFVKYVSLGVEVPGSEILEQNGVDVVDKAEGVPPVREVRLTVVPDTLGAVTPGVPTNNRLCATSGDLSEGIVVSVNDDPSQLPADVQVAFRAGATTLDEAGIPLTYTLANLPDSVVGPFTTYIQVQAEDPTVFLVPSQLPVTFSVAAPTPTPVPPTPTPVPPTPTPVPPTPTPTPTPIPTGTLTFGEFAERSFVRGMDEANVEWTLSIDLAAQSGGEVALNIDQSRLDEVLPGATLGFRTGDDPLADEFGLDGDQRRAELVLWASPEVLETLADGRQGLPGDVIVDPGDTDLTYVGATASPNADGTPTVGVSAPLVMLPTPTCSVEVGDLPDQAVTIGDTSSELVRWETDVELSGSDGCAGEIFLDDDELQQAIRGAHATFSVDGEERTSLDLRDNLFRADLVVTAPRIAVAALGPGEKTRTVGLIVAPERSLVELPEEATGNDNGSFTLPVPVRVTVSEQPRASCALPTFDEQVVVRDGKTTPALSWPGKAECVLSGGATVTMTVVMEESGASAHFAAEGGERSRSVTLAEGEAAPTLTLEVDRGVAQRLGEDSHEFGVDIELRAEPSSAALVVEGETPPENAQFKARVVAPVRVVEPAPAPVIALESLDLAPDVIELETHSTSPDPLGWRDALDYELTNGAQGTVAVDEATLPDGVSAFFEVGGIPLPSPVALAGQQGTIELVVQGSLAAAQALGAGRHQWTIPIVLDPQGAEVRWPGAARTGNNYHHSATAAMSITASHSADLISPAFDPQSISSVPPGGDSVFTAPIQYDLSDGAAITLRVDRSKLDGRTRAELTIDGSVADPVALTENGHDVEIVVTAPKSAFKGEGPFKLPVEVIAHGEGVYFTIDGKEADPDGELRLKAKAELTIDIPPVRLDLGTWVPEVLDISSTGTGTEPRRWERTITASGLGDGGRPKISVSEIPGPLAELSTIRLYANEGVDKNLLAEGSGSQPVTASFEPGRETITVVIEAPEDGLRRLELSDHQLSGTLTVDPNGALVETPGNPPSVEPMTDEFVVQARVYEPFDLIPIIQKVALGLLALLVLLAIIFLRPGLPANAGIEFDGNPAVPVAHGGIIGGPGSSVDIGASGFVGEIKGRVGGRLTGAAKFITTQPVTFFGNDVSAGDSIKITPGDQITPSEGGSEFTYVRDEGNLDYGAV